MPNRHLNYFRPLTSATHEDQLTRGALLVMRLIPLAHQEFLRRISPDLALADLAPAEIDTEVVELHPQLADEFEANGAASDQQLNVVSVFLTPGTEELDVDAEESDRRARFDGVIRFGDRLAVAIESKITDGIDPWQAAQIPLGRLAGHCDLQTKVAVVRWYELLDAWMRLEEHNLLGTTEREILADFFDMVGDNFADLLPFQTFARAGANEARLERRLGRLLEQATGLEPTLTDIWRVIGGWKSFERISIWASRQDELVVALWPGERVDEARRIYGVRRRADAVTALDGQTLGRARSA